MHLIVATLNYLQHKLNAYSFNLPALRSVHVNLSNRKQRIEIGNNYSTWMEIVFTISQISMLGSLLLIILLVDPFFIISGTDMQVMRMITDHVLLLIILMIYFIKSLQEAPAALFQWFDNILLKNGPEKCLSLIRRNETVTVNIG